MNRREFITLLGGATVVWPLAARAQQPAMPVVGVMVAGSAAALRAAIAGFQAGLKESGYVEGRMWRSNTVLPRVNSIAYLRSRPIWSAARWR